MALYQNALLDQMNGALGPGRRRQQVGRAFGLEDRTESGGWNGPFAVDAPPGFAPGEPDPNLPGPEETPVPAPAAPNYTFRNQMEGIDWTKFDNPEHKTPKYQIARTLAGFDPTKGLTSDAIAALNKLGLGTFSANREGGDFLKVDNGVPEFKGVKGADVVRDLGRGGWVGWGGNYGTPEAAEDQARRGGGMAATPMAGAQIASQLQGDPIARILAAIGKLSGSGSPNIDALLRQLQGV